MKFLILVLILIYPASSILSQEDSIKEKKKKENFLIRLYNTLFESYDTLYIEADPYYMNISVQNSNWFDTYILKSSDGLEQSITMSQDPSYNIGAYIGWDILSVGWSLNIIDTFKGNSEKSKKTEFDMSLIGTFIGCDMYYRQFTDGFRINNTHGIIDKNIHEDIHTELKGVESKLIGINGWYLFNRNRVAYPSVYSHSYRQLKSCGSFMLGASYTLHEFHFDPDKLPEIYKENLSDQFYFNKFSYHNISIGGGYTYNWKLGKNFNANVTIMPSLAYKISRIRKDEIKDPYYRNFQFELLGKTGIVYNNRKYFAGCNLQVRAYTNINESMSMINSLGYITAFIGFNFWKRK